MKNSGIGNRVNTNAKEFGIFVYNEHAPFICSVISGLCIGVGIAVATIGLYSKHIIDKQNNEY